MSEQRAARTLEQRISELAVSRPVVAAQMATVARERATAVDATRAAGHRLRPSGELGDLPGLAALRGAPNAKG